MELIYYYIAINIVGYAMMYKDKMRAKRGEWRIKEKTLWLMAWFGGAIFMTFAMWSFRHKTKHLSFKYGFPFLAILHIFILFLLRI
ncbi:DUF1294 domain-containing protein [Bacillus sp. FJAT-47783]|uniref:DUF1294 domain-containing protein n=1 Tax=Bacillus sp. FJAT-47783 TaxID=2922712 RepID=UPI001FADC048|nr:DUF1294 domain-containing protein [Bacillus sp. FJAT-47783]